MNVKVLGIDPGSDKMGWAVLGVWENLICSGVYRPQKKFKDVRGAFLCSIHDFLVDLIKEHSPAHVVIEEEAFGNFKVAGGINQLIGCAQMAAWNADYISTSLIPPSVWRKIVLGNGRMKRAEAKKRSITYVRTIYGIEMDDNEADAICLALAEIRKMTLPS